MENTPESLLDILNARSQAASPDTVTRPDGSMCLSDTQGKLFDYLICPLGFEEDTTSNSCPAETSPPALLRQSVPDNYEEPPMPDYSLDWSSKPLYDARGRRTQAEPNTRRYLFEKGNESTVRGTEPGMVELLREGNSSGRCCVDTFYVGPIDGGIQDMIIDDKVGAKVKFYAEFGRDNGCDPKCCEFKQEVMGSISRNDTIMTGTTCRIGEQDVFLNPNEYGPDCYGRKNCNSFENYNDALGIYNGTDYPGLNKVYDSTSVDIRMEFNSYIEDACSINKEIKDSRYWGFHLYGPASNLMYNLFGEMNQ